MCWPPALIEGDDDHDRRARGAARRGMCWPPALIEELQPPLRRRGAKQREAARSRLHGRQGVGGRTVAGGSGVRAMNVARSAGEVLAEHTEHTTLETPISCNGWPTL